MDEWNSKHPVGTPVTRYALINPLREPQETKTRSEAWLMGGHTAMVMVESVKPPNTRICDTAHTPAFSLSASTSHPPAPSGN